MKYSRTRDVKKPTRGTELSAGQDFYIPEDCESFRQALIERNPTSIVTNNSGIGIQPHSHALIPSGIKINLESTLSRWINSPYNAIALIAHNKSSIGIRQLTVGATVVDQDYQGDTNISLTNTSSEMIWVSYGQKIVQFLTMPIIIEPWDEVDVEELFTRQTQRSTGAFGSTGSA